MKTIAIFGGSGAIGSAFVKKLATLHPDATIHAFSRTVSIECDENVNHFSIDLMNEASISEASNLVTKEASLDMVIMATGILFEGALKPEKSLRDLSTEKFQRLFEVNTILPALIAKHFLPKLNKENRAIFAVLSARVGSISDNRLGGWYAYRASKAALNMIIKNAAIEISRQNKQAIVVGLHPGTVDSDLSKPFQNNVPIGNLFTPEESVEKLLEILTKLEPKQSGKCYAWDGVEIKP